MKTFSRTALSLLLLGGLGGIPTISSASETRVDATGGLTSILTDETTDLNLFVDGNPAGLVLLSTRDRVDLSGQWSSFDKAGPWGSTRRQVFSTLPQFEDTVIRYEGLMAFPFPNWAFQAAGDLSSFQGFPVAAFLDGNSKTSLFRLMARGAYAVPFGALGLEILDLQSDEKFDTGIYDATTNIIGGSSALNQLLLKTGVILAFPNPPSPESPRWQAGGSVGFQVGPSGMTRSLELLTTGPVSFTVNQTITTAGRLSLAGHLLYEVPTELQIRFSARVANQGVDQEQSLPTGVPNFTNLPKYRSSEFQTAGFQGSFRCVSPWEGEEVLKTGGSLGLNLDQGSVFAPSGAVLGSIDQRSLEVRLGAGLESNKEYTMGIQWKSRNHLVKQPAAASPDPAGDDFDLYQLVFGGEKWLSPTWAFRMGLTLEEDLYPSGISTLTTSVNSGVGLEQAFGRADIRLTLGQTTDLRNSSNAIGTIGIQLSTTLFF